MFVFWLKIICTVRRAQTGLVAVSGERIERQAVVFVFETLLLIESLIEIVQFVFGRGDVLLRLFGKRGQIDLQN